MKRRLIHHSKAFGPKVNFPDAFWWPSWIYADSESWPKLQSWQQGQFVLEPHQFTNHQSSYEREFLGWYIEHIVVSTRLSRGHADMIHLNVSLFMLKYWEHNTILFHRETGNSASIYKPMSIQPLFCTLLKCQINVLCMVEKTHH